MSTERAGRWMIYGASGYTGELVAEEAAQRGHRPILAGRSAAKLEPIADRLGLPYVVCALDEPAHLATEVAEVDLVFHAAGPFAHTSAPMIEACLAAQTNYVDVTGEISVFQATFERDAQAQDRGVCLISGVGFDVIPTDCLAKYVADQVPGATELLIAFAALGKSSRGTMKTAIEGLAQGGFVRRSGRLEPVPPAHDIRSVRFDDRDRTVVAIPWGDLETAYHSTGIGNITTYMAQPPKMANALRRFGPVMTKAFGLSAVRRAAEALVERTVTGPGEDDRRAVRSHVWARASDGRGATAEAWLETLEGYRFTAIAGVRAVERILERRPTGALTPSLAFGADFVLELPETKRFDALPATP